MSPPVDRGAVLGDLADMIVKDLTAMIVTIAHPAQELTENRTLALHKLTNARLEITAALRLLTD